MKEYKNHENRKEPVDQYTDCPGSFLMRTSSRVIIQPNH